MIYEQAKFNSCKQEDGEPVDSFNTDLYALAEHYDYKELHNETIRDRIVVSLRDAVLSKKLQLDSELTLERDVTKVQAETSGSSSLQSKEMRQSSWKCQ